ncbi:MAG: hypothetical protein GTO46_07850 [Gemmatimonadetes bacterium]|nr:hypothetical protein [Gemmatimonadota bacterium]NIO31540.1 hypothetical protein [Gemmatimonadota bacterium]
MPVSVRRAIYGLLSTLGFLMAIPFLLASRSLEAQLGANPFDPAAGLELTNTQAFQQQSLLFLVGLTLAAGFLYAALSVGNPRGWRPQENGTPSCSRCGAEIPFGVAHCPACEQRLTW